VSEPFAYRNNPGSLRFVNESKLPFKARETFKTADIEERGQLHRMLAEQVWDPEALLREVPQ
jgi:hypothetical protein